MFTVSFSITLTVPFTWHGFPFVMVRMGFYAPVPFIMAVSYNHLTLFTLVWTIFYKVNIMTVVRSGIIYHYFVSIIQIVTTVSWRKCGTKYPLWSLLINKLPSGNIIVGIHIRQIIVFCMIVPNWSPYRLSPDINANINLSIYLKNKTLR